MMNRSQEAENREGWLFGTSFSPLIILSPHCDDAALSIGGSLSRFCRDDRRVTILTCFSLSRYTRFSSAGSVEEISELRKSEDRAMVSRVRSQGLGLEYLEFRDAPLRCGRTSKNLFDGRILPNEEGLLELLTRRLQDHVSPTSTVFAPLGIGSHIDHLLSRMAIDRLASTVRKIVYYEDQPYAALQPGAGTALCEGLTPRLIPINPRDKFFLLDAYASQLEAEDLCQVLDYAATVDHTRGACERLWSSGAP